MRRAVLFAARYGEYRAAFTAYSLSRQRKINI